MSADFYRRPEARKHSRGEVDEDVRLARGRETSRNRSDSRPPVSRHTTAERESLISSTANVQSGPTADPRIRSVSTPTGFGEERAQNIVSTALSPVEEIASQLISFLKEAQSAAYTQRQEDDAKKRFEKAEKADRQNRKMVATYGAAYGENADLTEQRAESMKQALKLLNEAKIRTEESEKRTSAAAVATANRILESTKAHREEEVKQARASDGDFSRTTEEMKQIMDRTEATLTAASSQSQVLSEVKKELQQIKASAQITTKRIDELKELQKRNITGVKSEVAEVDWRCKNIVTNIEELKKELDVGTGNARNTKNTNQDLETLQTTVHELETRLKDIKATPQDVEKLQQFVDKIEKSGQERDATLQELKAQNEVKATHRDLESLRKAVLDVDKRRREENATLQSLEAIKISQGKIWRDVNATLNDRSAQEKSMVDDFEHFKQAITKLQADLSRQVAATRPPLQQDDIEVQEALSNIRKDVTATQAESRYAKQSVGNIIPRVQKVINSSLADVRKEVASARAETKKAFTDSLADHNSIGDTLRELREEVAASQAEFRNAHQAVTNSLPSVHKALNESKALNHSLRALSQRYENIDSSEMVNSMLRQIQVQYPHVRQHQQSLDALKNSIESLRTQSQTSVQSVADRVDIAITKLTDDIQSLTATVEKHDIEYIEKWEKVITEVKSQRDALKVEIAADIADLRNIHGEHTVQLEGLRGQIENFRSTAMASNGSGSARDFADFELPRIPAAKNPFAVNSSAAVNGTGTGLGTGLEKKRKRTIKEPSPDLVETGYRAGSGSSGLRAKNQRKG